MLNHGQHGLDNIFIEVEEIFIEVKEIFIEVERLQPGADERFIGVDESHTYAHELFIGVHAWAYGRKVGDFADNERGVWREELFVEGDGYPYLFPHKPHPGKTPRFCQFDWFLLIVVRDEHRRCAPAVPAGKRANCNVHAIAREARLAIRDFQCVRS